jgi:hypothetical protein
MEHYDRLIKYRTNILMYHVETVGRYEKYLNKTGEFY